MLGMLLDLHGMALLNAGKIYGFTSGIVQSATGNTPTPMTNQGFTLTELF